jgi:hypothetical protein
MMRLERGRIPRIDHSAPRDARAAEPTGFIDAVCAATPNGRYTKQGSKL